MHQNSLIILLLLIYLNLVRTDMQFPSNCGPEEVSVRCVPTYQPTCIFPEGSGPLICNGHCICRRDYIKNKDGKCILKKDCPGICSENSVHERCTRKYKQRCLKIKPEDNRINLCIPGCSCKNGYYWSEKTDSCLKLNDCLLADRGKRIPHIG